jgi:hypothetical protein
MAFSSQVFQKSSIQIQGFPFNETQPSPPTTPPQPYEQPLSHRFFLWIQRGIWEHLLEKVQINPDLEALMIDATIIRAQACSAGYGKNSQKEQALGRCVGELASRINATVDALVNPLKFLLSVGQQHDIKAAIPLIEKITGSSVLADKGYNDDRAIEDQGCKAVIPPRKNRKELREYDNDAYKRPSFH